MKKSARLFLSFPLFVHFLFAQGTQIWQQKSYEDFSKGTSKGVALRSNGTLVAAPGFDALYTSPSTYVWSAVSQPDGGMFLGAGSPARVYHVTPDGKATVVFEPKELQVQALALDKDGTLYAATSPDGKVYKLNRVQQGPDYTAREWFDPKTKYIWALALDSQGRLYVGTGEHGEIFRVTKAGEGAAFFKSDEAHIRTLEFDSNGNLIAGSDGSGLVYRISPSGEGFVLYSAPKKEITALALDAEGNIYAAAVGDKRSVGPNQPQPFISPAPTGPLGSAPMVGTAPQISGGSDVYMISPDGAARRLWTTKEDIIYALAFDPQKHLLAGTGNKGRIVEIGKDDTFSDLLQASASQVTAFAPAAKGALYAATSNLGKLFRLNTAADSESSFESDVFDARNFSRWGRAQVRGTGDFQIYTRSGNVDNPDRNWSAWRRVDLGKDARVESPPARFIQWKVVMPPRGNAVLDDVIINYLSKNVSPVVEEVVVQPGARVAPGTFVKPANDTLQINLGNQQNISGGTQPHFDPPLIAQKDKSGIVVRWAAHDDNDDDLVYSVYYKGDGESRWKLLKNNITDKFYSFDAGLLPDGGYTLRVTASDSPSHTPDEALTGSKNSSRFEVDTTPPRIDALAARMENGQLRVTFSARDTFSPIKRAEYSVDAGEWQFVEPVGHISDSQSENYDFRATTAAGDSAAEHTIVVRAYDRFDNMGSAKLTVK